MRLQPCIQKWSTATDPTTASLTKTIHWCDRHFVLRNGLLLRTMTAVPRTWTSEPNNWCSTAVSMVRLMKLIHSGQKSISLLFPYVHFGQDWVVAVPLARIGYVRVLQVDHARNFVSIDLDVMVVDQGDIELIRAKDK